jgi:hypothetical protein
MESLAFRTARKHIQNYERESGVMAEHDEAMDCLDCELYLQLGIDAFDWVMRADRNFRAAAAEHEEAYSQELQNALQGFCKSWLMHCETAEAWIKRQLARGFEIDNLVVFRECCRQMQAIVKFNESTAPEILPDAMIRLRDQALEDYRHGKTAEIFSEEESHDSTVS